MSLYFKTAKGSIAVFAQKHKMASMEMARDVAVILCAVCVAIFSYSIAKIDNSKEVLCPVGIENAFSQTSPEPEFFEEPVGGDKAQKSSSEGIMTPNRDNYVAPKQPETPVGAGGWVVASKNSDKYHYPWCGSAARIKEENKVWYQSEQDAIAAGLTKAKNCQ